MTKKNAEEKKTEWKNTKLIAMTESKWQDYG